MPRSCSTLMQNILNQNPTIHATPTDGSLELLFGARVNYTEGKEFIAQDKQTMEKAWKGFCLGGLQGYAEGLTDKPNVCIKSRGIGIHYDWYNSFLNQPLKIICCVRNLKGIYSSMEKIFRKQQASIAQGIQNHANMQGTTTFKRVIGWTQSPPVGLALERFHQMALEDNLKHCFIMRAEDLTSNPDTVMKNLYSYLELPYYQHNWDFIEQTTQEDDSVHGSVDLHTIKPRLQKIPEDWNTVLGEDSCGWLDNNLHWYNKLFGY